TQYGTTAMPSCNAVNNAVESSDLPDSDKQAAKDEAYNALSPAQQEEAKKNPSGAVTAPAAGPAAPAPVPHQTPAAPAPEGSIYIYDLQGVPHPVASNLADTYLANPQYKGWSK